MVHIPLNIFEVLVNVLKTSQSKETISEVRSSLEILFSIFNHLSLANLFLCNSTLFFVGVHFFRCSKPSLFDSVCV